MRAATDRRERGATLILVAVAMPVLLIFTALAVDIGIGAARTRDLQQVADLVSVDVARLFDGRSEAALVADPDFDAQVLESAAANDFAVTGSYPTYTGGISRRLVLDVGCFALDTKTFDPSCASGDPPNAVEVVATDRVDYKFADIIGIRDSVFDRDAIGARIPQARISVGSVAIGLQQQLDPINAGVGGTASAQVEALNARLRAAFSVNSGVGVSPPPNGVGLDLVSYRGLAASDVGVGDLASQAGFASPEELADATITNGELFEATARALEARGDTTGAASVRSFAGMSDFNSAGTMRLGDGPLIFEQGAGSVNDPGAARASVNVLSLLTGAATIANGRNFIGYQFNPGIPGVARVDVETYVVEAAREAYGWAGQALASTAQLRHQITIRTNQSGVLLGGLIPATIPINIPIVIEGATADALLTRTTCLEQDSPTGVPHPYAPSETEIAVTTSLARFRVGVAQNLQTPGALTVTAGAIISGPFIDLTTILTLGLSGLATIGQDLNAYTDASFGGGSSSHVFHPWADPNPAQRSMGGISANLGSTLQAGISSSIGATLNSALNTVFTNLAGRIIDPILHATGVSIGGADVRSVDDSLDCAAPELVG